MNSDLAIFEVEREQEFQIESDFKDETDNDRENIYEPNRIIIQFEDNVQNNNSNYDPKIMDYEIMDESFNENENPPESNEPNFNISNYIFYRNIKN